MRVLYLFFILMYITSPSVANAGIIGVITREVSQGASSFISRFFDQTPNKIEFHVYERFKTRLKREEIPCPLGYIKSHKLAKHVFVRLEPNKNAPLIGTFVKGERFCYKRESEEWSKTLFGWVNNSHMTR